MAIFRIFPETLLTIPLVISQSYTILVYTEIAPNIKLKTSSQIFLRNFVISVVISTKNKSQNLRFLTIPYISSAQDRHYSRNPGLFQPEISPPVPSIFEVQTVVPNPQLRNFCQLPTPANKFNPSCQLCLSCRSVRPRNDKPAIVLQCLGGGAEPAAAIQFCNQCNELFISVSALQRRTAAYEKLVRRVNYEKLRAHI